MNAKPRLTAREHSELAPRLKALREELVEISVRLRKAYPAASLVARHAKLMTSEIDKVRYSLEDEYLTSPPADVEHFGQNIYFKDPS
jgi:hypothetical protein